jgi:hypothetical protein
LIEHWWAGPRQEFFHGHLYCDGPQDVSELAEAETRFKELTGLGFTAATRTAAGETLKVASFDPTAEETLFFARLVGG